MPTILRDYLNKNLSSIVARSSLGLKLRPIVQNALLPSLGDKSIEELSEEAVIAWGEARLKEPKKDGSARSQASVEQELEALDHVLAHARGAGAGKLGGAGKGAEAKGSSISGPAAGVKSKLKRGTQRGR